MVLKISSQVSSAEAVLRAIQMLLVRDDLQYRVNLTFEEAILELKKRLNTIVKQAVVHVMAQVLSQEQVQSLVDAVMALVSLTSIHRPHLV